MPGSNGNPAGTDEYGNRLQEMLQEAQANAQQAKATAAEEEAQASRDPVSERIAAELAKVKGDPPAAQPEPPDDFEDESQSPDELVEQTVEQFDDVEEESKLVQETGPAGSGEKEVQQGECVSSIAMDTGHFWETLCEANPVLRDIRDDLNVLLKGDRLTVPPLRRKEKPGNTEQHHRFRRRGWPEILRIRLVDEDGEGRAEIPYVLIVDGEQRAGTTDPNGELKEPIAPNAREGMLIVGEEKLEFPLQLGNLDPVTEITGVQQRLANLGFDCGPADGLIGPRTRAALTDFQYFEDLKPTGRMNDATRNRLDERYRSEYRSSKRQATNVSDRNHPRTVNTGRETS